MSYGLTYDEISEALKSGTVKFRKAFELKEQLINHYEVGLPNGKSTGLRCLDEFFRWQKGRVYCFTGYPGSGKSEMMKFLSVLWVKNYGGKVAMYSPEEDNIQLVDDLAQCYLEKNTNPNYPNQCKAEEYNEALTWINDNYVFLEYEGLVNIQTLLGDYESLTLQGFDFFVTDPFNYVAEGSMDDGKGISKYLKTALTHMKTFAKKNEVINAIVEHPRQPIPRQDGTIPRVNQFMLYGGSMWNNKMDGVVAVHRNWENKTTTWETLKMKAQKYNGKPGEKELLFDVRTNNFKDANPF